MIVSVCCSSLSHRHFPADPPPLPLLPDTLAQLHPTITQTKDWHQNNVYLQVNKHVTKDLYPEVNKHVTKDLYPEVNKHVTKDLHPEVNKHVTKDLYPEVNKHVTKDLYPQVNKHGTEDLLISSCKQTYHKTYL